MDLCRGIALHYIKFKESSIVASILTDKEGVQSFIVNGVRTSKAKTGMALFQPLTLLEFGMYKPKGTQTLRRFNNIHCVHPFEEIGLDYHKTCIALFTTELIHKCLRDNPEQEELFDFLWNAALILDTIQGQVGLFPLHFLVKMSRFLGIAIPSDPHTFFESLQEMYPPKTYNLAAIPEEEYDLLRFLIFQPMGYVFFTSLSVKRNLLRHLITYYAHHISSLQNLQSLEVMKELFYGE